MKIFFGGIMQGSHQGNGIHSQDYRKTIKKIIETAHPDFELFDPFAKHAGSINYTDSEAKETFFHHLDILKSCDLLLAYLPEASLGTAVEMWQAYDKKIPIITISPMTSNWVIRIFSDTNFESVDDFEQFIKTSGLAEFKTKSGDRLNHQQESA